MVGHIELHDSFTTDLRFRDAPVALVLNFRVPQAGRCGNFTRLHQPTPTSHLAAMVCDNFYNMHILKDCIINGSASDRSINTVGIISLSDRKSSDNEATPTPMIVTMSASQ